ncbi:hypothetical protein [Mycobacterium sp. 1274761.0]|uniref:hypothetical protein n=1 Tax=Mycobacterium sp. 1274761.0 TaxID=1834077 RepID=UPI0007FF58B7|nr:hypothetical protein [Mycobacterium sp. 1274761.0]OBK70794.1 hypothetical protein A5651_21435 [Mycobacterium sp. 1274761.0]
MTGPEDSYSNTRPISVAELLAKNGTIGAPPVGGRRRRRRGNSDAVTVAELTGEIPIITDDTPKTAHEAPVADDVDAAGKGAAEHVDEDTDVRETASDQAALTEEEADYAAHLEEREEQPLFFEPPPRRPQYTGLGPKRYPGRVGAEEMSPDPVDIDDDDAVEAVASDQARTATAPATDTDDDALPSYLRSSGGTLFGGETGTAHRGGPSLDDLEFGDADVEHEEEDLEGDDFDVEAESPMSSLARGALVVGQCIVAVLFGAGLFIAFDQLWKWNNIVALVLSVLVILGLVVGVRIVRKTEDIGSTLIAVAVGALVTLGPLALLQSG